MERITNIDLNQVYNGKPIKEKRKKLGLSAKELADLIGVKEGNIYKWEKGTKPHDPEDFLKIEKWLSEKLETVPRATENGRQMPQDGQDGNESAPRQLDLVREVIRLKDQQLALEATLNVVSSELVPLVAKLTGRSHASVSSQLKKDVDAETVRLIGLVNKRKSHAG